MTIPARSPDGEEHLVVYEGPEHLIPLEAIVIDLPKPADGERWVLVRRKIDPEGTKP